ncbi:MAG: hypothetical protein P4L31_06895 [Candidatus Babeliales bacterium]|nr:hypothetical protein [Candidatus Babeliales bacterium]
MDFTKIALCAGIIITATAPVYGSEKSQDPINQPAWQTVEKECHDFVNRFENLLKIFSQLPEKSEEKSAVQEKIRLTFIGLLMCGNAREKSDFEDIKSLHAYIASQDAKSVPSDDFPVIK